MTVRTILKCDVCGTTMMLRTQVGWLFSHPIRIHCGECNCLISGRLLANPKTASAEVQLRNATEIEESAEAPPAFYAEASGELLVRKVERLTTDPMMPHPPPFFGTLWAMGNKSYESFKERTIRFLTLREREWPTVRRINELWLSGRLEYLRAEVWKILRQDKFPMNNRLESMRGTHNVNLMFLQSTLDFDRFMASVKFIRKEITGLASSSRDELGRLADDFTDQGLWREYDGRVFHGLTQWVEIFSFIIPAFGLRFYEKEPDDLAATTCGMSSASFEDLKQFYVDTFESSVEMMRLVVALNNLKHRGNFEQMAARRGDVTRLEEYDRTSKGNRLQFVDGTETFDCLVSPPLDNRLRNAIGHFSYQYDGMRQIVTYFPSGSERRGNPSEISLIAFARLCLDRLQCLWTLGELVYCVHKLEFIRAGEKGVDPALFSGPPESLLADDLEPKAAASRARHPRPRKRKPASRRKKK